MKEEGVVAQIDVAQPGGLFLLVFFVGGGDGVVYIWGHGGHTNIKKPMHT